MDKKRTVQRKKVRKKGGPKLKFKLGTIFTIFLLSFLLCFLIYMINVNTDDTFLDKEFGTSLLTSDTENDDAAEESKVDTVSEAEDTAFSNPVKLSFRPVCGSTNNGAETLIKPNSSASFLSKVSFTNLIVISVSIKFNIGL